MPKTPADNLRKPALINATLECIAERGIEAITLELVAERAGCSKGVAAYHFGTKQALVLASLQAFLDSYQARLRDPGVATAQGFLDLLIDTALPPWQDQDEAPINVFPLPDARAIRISPSKKARLFVNFIARACQDEAVRDLLATRYRDDVAGIGQILAALARERGGQASDPAGDAYRFLALVYGLAFFRVGNFFPDGYTDNRHILEQAFGGEP